MAISLTLLAVLLLVGGIPVSFCILIVSIAALIVLGLTNSFATIPQMLVGAVQSYLYSAIPLFLLAGGIMNETGATDRLFKFVRSVVGHLRGGLGYVNVLASLIFAGMSGSAMADTGGLGMIEIKMMKDQGYDVDFAAAITASSATIGPIFPPSIPMLIFGGLAGVSIAKLFAAGIVPALVMCLFLMVTIFFVAKKRHYPQDQRASFKEILISFRESFLALLLPVIILGGIGFGFFTPTEAAAVATFYALFLGFVVYKTMRIKSLLAILGQTALNTAIVMIIIAATGPFKWLIAFQKVPDLLYTGLTHFTSSPEILLLILNLVFLGIGCIMENTAVIILSTPILMPIVTHFGIDPVHFGVVMILNLMIGLVTPPVGISMFTVCAITKLPLERFIKANRGFFLALIGALIVITYVPSIVTWLPNLFFKRF
jgi:tripartite ATP-independent transporter DctM subunit